MKNERRTLNVILVGSNPLPCYVQAAYVLRRDRPKEEMEFIPCPDQILLVVTQETDQYAENIKNVLRETCDMSQTTFSTVMLRNSGRGMKEVEERVIQEVKNADDAASGRTRREGDQDLHYFDHIVLNNTGGTKTMAVYGTMGARAFLHTAGVTECYVDPDSRRLRCYPHGGSYDAQEIIFPDVNGKDLRSYVQISIRQLIALHFQGVGSKCLDENGMGKEGNTPGSFGQTYLDPHPELMEMAEKVLKQEESYRAYSRLYDEYDENRGARYRGNGGKKQFVRDLPQIAGNDPQIQGLLGEILYWGEKERKAWADIWIFKVQWLEIYFYKALLEAKQKLEKDGILIQTAWSWSAKISENKNFEVDVLALNGYELTLYSITSAGRDNRRGEVELVKNKWFECVYRVEQIAGEHGISRIINFLDGENLAAFKEDLAVFQKDKVVVYNYKDLEDYDKLVERLIAELG